MRRNLFEHLQPFSARRRSLASKACDLTAGMRDARHQSQLDRIDNLDKHDGYRATLLLQRPHGIHGIGENHIWIQSDELRHVNPRAFGIGFGPAIVNADVSSLRPTQLLEVCKNGLIRLDTNASSSGKPNKTPSRRAPSGDCAIIEPGRAINVPAKSEMKFRRLTRSPHRLGRLVRAEP